MDYHIREEQGHHIIRLDGDIDLEQSPKVRQLLLEAVENGKQVLVDLEAVTYLDSSGIATLVEAFQQAKKKGTALILANLSPAVTRVLNMARLDKVFCIHDSVETAIHANI